MVSRFSFLDKVGQFVMVELSAAIPKKLVIASYGTFSLTSASQIFKTPPFHLEY